MLGKVMKYDLKWICKPLLVFYILGLAFSGAARLLSNIQNSIVFTVITQICYGAAISMMVSIVMNYSYANFICYNFCLHCNRIWNKGKF